MFYILHPKEQEWALVACISDLRYKYNEVLIPIHNPTDYTLFLSYTPYVAYPNTSQERETRKPTVPGVANIVGNAIRQSVPPRWTGNKLSDSYAVCWIQCVTPLTHNQQMMKYWKRWKESSMPWQDKFTKEYKKYFASRKNLSSRT